jgi:hypothetical protein
VAIDYNRELRDNFFRVPGEHMIEGGQTGSGKTQGLYWILAGIRENSPDEAILWFDTGKTAEILKLCSYGPVLVHLPIGAELEIQLKPGKDLPEEIEIKYFVSVSQIIENLSQNKINVVCLEPFFPDPDDYAHIISSFFKTLIDMARKYQVIVPLAIFFDEFHWAAPAQGHALNEEHTEGAKWIQRNIEMLRSMGIRIVATCQDWTKLRKGVRSTFNWIMIRRGLQFSNDQGRLATYNWKWQTLRDDTAVLVFPDKMFTDFMRLPFYGDGRTLGRVYYHMEKTTG